MSTTQIPGAEIILKALADQGVEVIFGYPGGAVLPIYDAIYQQNQVRHILVRQEGGAVLPTNVRLTRRHGPYHARL